MRETQKPQSHTELSTEYSTFQRSPFCDKYNRFSGVRTAIVLLLACEQF